MVDVEGAHWLQEIRNASNYKCVVRGVLSVARRVRCEGCVKCAEETELEIVLLCQEKLC